MTQSDPTDHALATIASILDQPESHRPAEKPTLEEKAAPLVPEDPDGYFKLGPGPITAIRFKWTVRRAGDGGYFVEETIGETSNPLVNGPMTKEAAVRLVDERESEARGRFDHLRAEISGRASALEIIRKGGADF